MFWFHFVSNNISLYRDTSETIYQYVYTLYRCNSCEYKKLIVFTMNWDIDQGSLCSRRLFKLQNGNYVTMQIMPYGVQKQNKLLSMNKWINWNTIYFNFSISSEAIVIIFAVHSLVSFYKIIKGLEKLIICFLTDYITQSSYNDAHNICNFWMFYVL